MACEQVHNTAPHAVVSAGRPLRSRRLRRRSPRSLDAAARRSVPTARQRIAVDDVSAFSLLITRCGTTAFAEVHVGPPMASPDHGADIRARERGDNTRGRLAEEAPCEAGASFKNFTLLQKNIRGFLTHRAELEGQLRLLAAYPAIIRLNETFLDE